MEQHCLRQCSVRLFLAFLLWSPAAFAQATIVQISDTHIGLSTAPNALQHLQTVVNQINAMSPQPDAVIVSGDIGETTSAWTTAKNTLANLKAVVYFCPGNHDIHTTNIATYRQYFGNDYYSFRINNITFMVVDSQLLGNYDTFNSSATPASVQPLPSAVQTESDTMLTWLGRQTAVANEIAVQHVPLFPQSLSGGGTYPSTNPYWAIYDVQNDTNIHHEYRTEEINALTALNIHTMLSAMTILDGGTEQQKKSFLPRLAGGELGTFALTEPEAGSDAGAVQTRAVRENGYFRLDGVKSWVTNGGPAGVHVVLALTNPGATHHGLSAFIVDAQTPGSEARPDRHRRAQDQLGPGHGRPRPHRHLQPVQGRRRRRPGQRVRQRPGRA